MVEQIITGAEVAANVATVVDTAYKVKRSVSRLKYAWNWCHPNVKIVVFGDSGSGKSSFLSRTANGEIYKKGSTRSVKKIKFQLPTGRVVEFYDCPGQKSLEAVRSDIRRKILGGYFDGIINVVCYGYNESENARVEMFEKDSDLVSEKFLKDQRERELERVNEWIKDVNRNSKVDWVLTLVNKADIWLINEAEVMDYYTQGEYKKAMEKLEPVCNDVDIIKYCSVISPFGGREMPIIMSEKDKDVMHGAFIEKLQELINR